MGLLSPNPGNGRERKSPNSDPKNSWGLEQLHWENVWGEVCRAQIPCTHFPPEAWSARPSTQPSSQPPSFWTWPETSKPQEFSVLQSAIRRADFHLNSRNCMSLFISVTAHQRDIVFYFSKDFSSRHPSSPSHPLRQPYSCPHLLQA